MTRFDTNEKYPTLFAPIDNARVRAQFTLLEVMPPEDLIGNVYLVPRVKEDWLYLIEANGRYQFPGGKKDPGENHLETIRRELMEEAGARLHDFQIIGAWHSHMKDEKPLLPHLPHPESYALVGTSQVEVVGPPTNPEGAGQTLEVHIDELNNVVNTFQSNNRPDLADLYELTSDIIAK